MFTFDDANADGRVVLSEVVHLTVGAISAPGFGPLGGQQQIFSFDYVPDTGLSFAAYDGWRYHITTGVSYRYDSPSGSTIEVWLPTTTTSLYPIPEPGARWMWLAGGAALALRTKLGRCAPPHPAMQALH